MTPPNLNEFPRRSTDLTEREEMVLRRIVQHYILTANPVGSRYLSKRLDEESVSAATIRNVMSDLEEKGYITHPHTSAGRVPTDRGYRLYVDSLIQIEKLSAAERSAIRKQIDPTTPTPIIMKDISRLLGAISLQLGIVSAPELLDSTLDRIEVVPLSSTRVLVVLSLRGGLIRTVTVEVHQEISREKLEPIVQILNERLGGITLRQIKSSFHERLSDVASADSTRLLQQFLHQGDRIFSQGSEIDRVHISPTQNILRQPEFSSPEQVRGVVELIENEEMIIHLLEEHPGVENTVEVTIGMEHGDERLTDFSLITTRYQIGNASGTIGLIGPKRMNYSKMITVVEYVARTITDNLQDR